MASKLAKIDAEKKANDPAALKKEIARLKYEIDHQAAPSAPQIDPQPIYERGFNDGVTLAKQRAAEATHAITALTLLPMRIDWGRQGDQWTGGARPAAHARTDHRQRTDKSERGAIRMSNWQPSWISFALGVSTGWGLAMGYLHFITGQI